MKKIIFLALVVINLNALDAISSISEEEKSVVASIVDKLNLPKNSDSNEKIYKKLKSYFVTGWSAHWTSNTTGEKSKVTNSKTQICDVMIYNNNRVVNTTFVYFKKEKQLFVTIKEYVHGKSDLVLERYKKLKQNSEYVVNHETDNYAYFNQKGYMDYEAYHIKGSVGMIVYESTIFDDIK